MCFNMDLLVINMKYILFVILIQYYASSISICISILIKEQSLIPLLSTLVTFSPIFIIYNFLDLEKSFEIYNIVLMIAIIIINLMITYIGSILIKRNNFITSI
jgi:hypothetical protein